MDTAAEANPILAKLATARQNKDTADQAFKAGDVQKALQSYHLTLLYVQGIDKGGLQSALGGSTDAGNAEKSKEKTEADEMIEKVYANMSACHIKKGNWQRALECADKALSKNENNYKAMFRKAKALGETGYFERAERILDDIIRKSPADEPAAKAELARLRAMDKERERKHNQKLKGWLSRDKNLLKADDEQEGLVEQVQSAKIEEIKE